MRIAYKSYNDFLDEYKCYHMDQCSKCRAVRELTMEKVDIQIEDRIMHFQELLVLSCTSCTDKCLPMHSKQMIDGCYKIMKDQGHYERVQSYRGYRKKFDYCQAQDFIYDHRDYYSIPGLCYDDEHSIEGFLTPVYFHRKALLYFISDPEYVVDIFSETYGYIGKKDSAGVYEYDWTVPFGFNTNGVLVFWLGDLDSMDIHSRTIFKSFNIDSDHLLIDSEFYRAQMNCIFSDPIKEKQILINKENFISNILNRYGIDLKHLDEECKNQAKNIKRPIVFNEQSVSGAINAFDKILVEGISVAQLRLLYEKLYEENFRGKNYVKWQSIRLLKEILKKFCENLEKPIDIEKLISPLYILHDYRIYLDHLLSKEQQAKTKQHIVNTLLANDFSEQEKIYFEEIERLNVLFQYFVLLSK